MPAKILTPENREIFLDALRDIPNVTAACRKIGIVRQAVYDVYTAEPDFAKRWDEAIKEGVETMEIEAHRRAVLGIDKPITFQGVITNTVKEYSDTLMIFLLKAHDPKYKDRQEVTHKVNDEITARLLSGRDRTGG